MYLFYSLVLYHFMDREWILGKAMDQVEISKSFLNKFKFKVYFI